MKFSVRLKKTVTKLTHSYNSVLLFIEVLNMLSTYCLVIEDLKSIAHNSSTVGFL